MKKIKPSDLRAEAQRLIREGKLPTLTTLLDAIAETRVAVKPKIRKVRLDLKRVQ